MRWSIVLVLLWVNHSLAFDHIARLSYRPYKSDLLLTGTLEFKKSSLEVVDDNVSDRFATTVLRATHEISYGLCDRFELGTSLAWTFLGDTRNTESSNNTFDGSTQRVGPESMGLFSSFRVLNQNYAPFNWDAGLALNFGIQSFEEPTASSPNGNASLGGLQVKLDSTFSRHWDIFELLVQTGLVMLGERTGTQLVSSGNRELTLSSRLDLFFKVAGQWEYADVWLFLLDFQLYFYASEDRSMAGVTNVTTSRTETTLGTEAKYLFSRRSFTALKLFFQVAGDYNLESSTTPLTYQGQSSIGFISSYSILF